MIFTENANLSKTGFKEKNHTIGSTDHQVQFFNGFAIFHKPQHTQGLWKIAKKHNPLVKFGCETLTVKLYFFQKMKYFFLKNQKKILKKWK